MEVTIKYVLTIVIFFLISCTQQPAPVKLYNIDSIKMNAACRNTLDELYQSKDSVYNIMQLHYLEEQHNHKLAQTCIETGFILLPYGKAAYWSKQAQFYADQMNVAGNAYNREYEVYKRYLSLIKLYDSTLTNQQ